MFFFTIQEMPLATATTLQYLSPAFTVILAQFMLGERVKKMQWWFMGIALVGILVMRGLDPNFKTGFFVIGILSALFSGVAYNAIMKCRGKDHPITVVLYFPLIATPIMGVWCLFDWEQPHGNEWWFILGIGVLTQIAQYSMTQALTIERAALVTPFKYLGAIYAAVFGWLLFDEILGIWTMIGMITVISALILNSLVGKMQKA
jgi:drug/metabolite transporter (DMT)-like permease